MGFSIKSNMASCGRSLAGRNWRWSLTIIGLIFSIIVALRGRPAKEPIYQGRELSAWLPALGPFGSAKEFASPDLQGEDKCRKAEEAVKVAGTNALPILLRFIRAREESHARFEFIERVNSLGILKTEHRWAYERHYAACQAYRLLGTNAKAAVPDLMNEFTMSRVSGAATSSARAAATALGAIGPAAREAIPILVSEATNDESFARCESLEALVEICSQEETVVPVLIHALTSNHPGVRSCGASLLGKLGVKAKSAVPALQALLQDGHKTVRTDASNALVLVDAQAAARVGVVP